MYTVVSSFPGCLPEGDLAEPCLYDDALSAYADLEHRVQEVVAEQSLNGPLYAQQLQGAWDDLDNGLDTAVFAGGQWHEVLFVEQ